MADMGLVQELRRWRDTFGSGAASLRLGTGHLHGPKAFPVISGEFLL
jgi:hypothetical protein